MSPLTLYVVRSLATRRLTTALTIGSLAVVSFTIASLLAAGAGLYRVFRTDATRPYLLHVLRAGANDFMESSIPFEAIAPLTSDSRIGRHSAEKLVRVGIKKPAGGIAYDLLRGLDPAGIELRDARVVEGRFPENGAREVAVGVSFAKNHPDFKIGYRTDLLALDLVVVGVFLSPTPLDNQELWTSRDTLRTIQTGVNELFLETSSAADEQAVADALASQRISPVSTEDTRVMHAKAIHKFDSQFNWLLLVFILVSGGGTLAVTGALTMIFARRTPEVAVLRAVGFRVRRIAMLQLTETMLLAFVGCSIGCATAALLLPGVSLASNPPFGTTFSLKLAPFELTATFVAMLLIGLSATLLPLVRLRRLDVRSALMDG